MSRGAQSPSLAGLFAALADSTRLRLLNLMAGREVCVCHFVEILGQSQPKISRHLAYLRRAGIVAARREGKWVYYSIRTPADAAAASVLASVLHSLGNNRQMRTDRSKLKETGPGRGCLLPLPASKSSVGPRKAEFA